jgi:glucose-6-phosphate 1-dehydrogenase
LIALKKILRVWNNFPMFASSENSASHTISIKSKRLEYTSNQPFGTEGRGGYFDSFGIIRDILQNHLLQVLTLFAMEPPVSDDARAIRDAKVEVLQNMDVLSLEDALLGQYDGYVDDPTIENKETNCPTYALIRCSVHTPRWEGVPMILEAGKALNEKICEVRVRFRDSKNLSSVRRSAKGLGPSELVMRLQPNPALELHTNIKSPGLSTQPTMSVMKMNYEQDIPDLSNPDAYTRLLLDVLRGSQGSFVRDDELRRSWEIFTPLLHAIDNSGIRPQPYNYGSEGPSQRKMWMEVMTGNAKLKSSL